MKDHRGSSNDDDHNPFDDTFQFEDETILNNTNGDRSRGEGNNLSSTNRQSEPLNEKNKLEEQELTFNDETTFDAQSFQPTPRLMNEEGVFNDIDLDNDNDESASKYNFKSDPFGMKRLRLGTQRHTAGFGRSKTMKWARKNITNPFEDNSKAHSFDESGTINRSNEFRTIYHNLPLPKELLDEDGKPITTYPRNKIRTTKYTPLTFIPKNIAFQFQNFANVYFLVLIILGAFQIFGVTNPGLSAVPLIVIVVITAFKDAIEDSRRTVLDLEVNNTKSHILSGVVNENVASDDVSQWRKFKKANTRLMFKLIEWCKEHMTEEGRRKRALRNKRSRKLGRKPQNSLDSFGTIRESADYGRPSLDFDNMGQLADTTKDITFIDYSLQVSQNCKFEKDFWKNVKVGDVVRIHNNDEIPADIVLLSSSDADGACYIETKNLDGETNLKVRQSLKCSTTIRTSKDVARTRFWIESEGPHANLYSYQANMKWNDPTDGELKNEPISINNLLLRGCTLRNTKWALGIVVFTGDDTKIMLNAGVTPTKKSRISRELNYSVLINFLVLFILCFISGLTNGIYYDKSPRSRNFFEFGKPAGHSSATNGFVSFWVAVILYQSLVPISLYISVEIIKTAQAAFIYGDVLLYNAKLDYPCTPKSWNISDDLGQIEYIFSDKTGTLTQNIMEFKKCTINGVSYGRAYTEALAGLRKRQGIDVETEGRREKAEIAKDRDIMINELRALSANSQFYPEDITFVSKEFAKDLKGASGITQQKCCEHFMLALALCHSVLIETNPLDPHRLDLKAQSPDEEALVTTARDMGFNFIGKTKNGLVVEVQGVQKEFEILNILEFNSSRKRMSCIVKIPPTSPNDEPRALLLCKGADSIIYSRLSTQSGINNPKLLEKTALHLEQYATEGLRTLCVAQREISWSEYTEWNERYNIAAASLVNREDDLEEVADSIEREMVLLGGTAIEDRLQDGVPDSIALLAQAGIKLWVLTGDKVETAINIGFSCNLLNTDMELLVIKSGGSDVEQYGDDPVEIVETLISKYLHEKFGLFGNEAELAHAKSDHEFPRGNFAVVIDGDALKLALQGETMKRKFLLLCKNCKAVLCCRVSPSQKAAVVKLVKNSLDVMTLAIGDGSNDVAMIQSADVGVGIAGEEGRQAVMCSDYAIGNFRYLTRLVLVHGRWSYKRLSEMIPEFFYKNVIFTLALFWYGIYNDFDGSYLFEYTFLMFYSLAFTSVPVILLGVLDQDVSDTISLVIPQLYRSGILRLEWNQTKFLWYMLDGLYQSAICFFFPYCMYHRSNLVVTRNGMGLEHRYYVGTIVTTIAVFACNIYIMMHQYRWDWFSGLFILLSCIIVFAWTGIWSSSYASLDFYKAGSRIYGSPSFWAVFIVGIIFCLLPRFTYDTYQKFFYPSDVDLVREMWKRGDFDQYPEGYDPTDPNRPNIMKISKYGERLSSNTGIIMNNSFSTSNVSLVTEEISMNFLDHDDSQHVGQHVNAAEQIPEGETANPFDDGNVHLNNSNSPRDLLSSPLADAEPKNSLDQTRKEMLASNELDNRYSVDRARTSLDLPGVTHAASLMNRTSADRKR